MQNSTKKNLGFIGATLLVAALCFNSVSAESKVTKLDANFSSTKVTSVLDTGCRTGVRWTLAWDSQYQTNVCYPGGAACCQ